MTNEEARLIAEIEQIEAEFREGATTVTRSRVTGVRLLAPWMIYYADRLAALRSSGAEPTNIQLVRYLREAAKRLGEGGDQHMCHEGFELADALLAGSSPSPAHKGSTHGDVDNDSIRGAAGARGADVGDTPKIQTAQVAPSPAPERPK